MREIKFRAWDKVLKKMWWPRDFIQGEMGIFECDVTIVGDECELMQYTGLKDKDGKEIYEGDIVIAKGDVSILYVVKFGQYMYSDACFFLEEISNTNPPLRFFSRGIDQTEIIGNIHQNPELL